MADVYLREDIHQLLRDRRQEYAEQMADPDDLNELIRLLVADADRARALDASIAEAVVESGTKQSVWSEP